MKRAASVHVDITSSDHKEGQYNYWCLKTNIKIYRAVKGDIDWCESRRRGLVVEARTPEWKVRGSILTQVAVLCPGARYIYW